MKFLLRGRICLLLMAALLTASGLAQGSAPKITKIDPPNWWVGLPDPMLLVYGEGLKDATISVKGSGAKLVKTQASENGHYAFLWLQRKQTSPTLLHIIATNAAGSASADFEWKSRVPVKGRYQGFSSADVMYLIMTDRFATGHPGRYQRGYDPASPQGWHGGDLRGATQHLDYIQSLGATTLWTTPVYANGDVANTYHGYAAVDLYAVDKHFGDLAEYKELADAIHARGMKIVMDIVPNHIGVKHPWVADPPAAEWLHGTVEHHDPVKYNFEAMVDPHASPSSYYNITHGWFVDSMPDMNQENPLVAQYLIQNALWWIETAGLDGLRIDTFPYVGRAFWQEFHKTVHSVYPNLTTVGEVFNGDPTITSFFAGGVKQQGIDTGLDTPFDFPVYYAIRDVLLHDKPMTKLPEVMRQDRLYPHPERLVFFFGNHDTNRFISETGATPERLKLAFGMLATLRGMPEIYSGDEIAMEGGNDPDNRRDFPGGFEGKGGNAFHAGGRTAVQETMYQWTSQLFALRAKHAAMQTGAQQFVFADDTGLAYVRAADIASGCAAGHATDRVFVVLNKASESRAITVPMKGTALEGCSRVDGMYPANAAAAKVRDGSLVVEVPAMGFAAYQAE